MFMFIFGDEKGIIIYGQILDIPAIVPTATSPNLV